MLDVAFTSGGGRGVWFEETEVTRIRGDARTHVARCTLDSSWGGWHPPEAERASQRISGSDRRTAFVR